MTGNSPPDLSIHRGLSRRHLLQTAALSTAAIASTGLAAGDGTSTTRPESAPPLPPAFGLVHELKPLPFEPAKLKGLSSRLIESHWTNNYGGSVRALNEVQIRLFSASKDPATPNFLYNGLKREHLMRTGSVILHELYFDNLGGSGVAGERMRSTLAEAFGTFDAWLSEFRRVSLGLGGGSGWVVLAWNHHFRALENYWLADHMHYPAGSDPLLVIDLYEHSYQMDFGAATARYVDAFFDNLNWEVVQARYETALQRT